MEIVYLIVGWLLGVATSEFYSRKQTKELRAIFTAFAILAEERGWVKWTRDAKGHITTGRTYTVTPATGGIQIRGNAPAVFVSATPTATGDPKDPA